ncbi:SDR family oxidoreductase [Algoriphagus jejuensis]|uniref:SDR family oxidoreductase n=1 Tax=Algoriphagus jejuensis TaxID=419934 RepID=A0ABP3YGB1_9BACT
MKNGKKKILISGGLGFVGKHLTCYLLEQGHELTLVDNLSGSDCDTNRIEALRQKCRVFVMNFLDFKSTETFDEVYHLASPVGAIGILKSSGRISKEIVDLAVKASEIALENNAKLMYISSSEVYYASEVQEEESNILLTIHQGARIEYAMGKYAGEISVRNFGLHQGLKYNICRPFNLIGKDQSSKLGFVVPRFIESCRQNTSLEVFHDGQQVRSFCHIDDFLEGLVSLQNSELVGETINLGNIKNKTTILELAYLIIELTGSTAAISFVNPSLKYGKLYMEGGEKIANTKKANSLLGYEPKIELREAIQKIIS